MTYSVTKDILPIIWLSASDDYSPLHTPEFLKREYRLEAVRLSEVLDTQPERGTILAHAYTYPEEIERLKVFAPRSVRLFLVADETHRPDLLKAILRTPAISEVMRNYPYVDRWPTAQVARSLRASLLQTAQVPAGMWLGAGRAVVAGAVMTFRKYRHSHHLRASKLNVIGVPLGYTDDFVRGLRSLIATAGWRTLGDEESIISYLNEHEAELEGMKSHRLGFVGQIGKFQRRAGVRAAVLGGYQIGPIRQSFAAVGLDRDEAAIEYVSSLAVSRFALCPPGNYSGDSFRLAEATLLRSIPVETLSVMSEPDRGPSMWVGSGSVRGMSWRSAIAEIKGIDEQEAKRLADVAGQAYREHVALARCLVRGEQFEK